MGFFDEVEYGDGPATQRRAGDGPETGQLPRGGQETGQLPRERVCVCVRACVCARVGKPRR